MAPAPSVDLDAVLGAHTGLVAPRYRDDWIGGVVPGILADDRPVWFPAPARQARTVVLLVVDGLGTALLHRHAPHTPRLHAMAASTITATVPSTTAAGLTSIATGAVPAVHGLIGYRFRLGGQVLSPLRWEFAGGAPGPDPAQTQPVVPFLGRRAAVINHREFATSGFTRAHLRGAAFRGYEDVEDLPGLVLAAVAEGERFVYAYDDRVDKAGHAEGIDADAMIAALRGADAVAGQILDGLPPEAVLMVTADHGHLAVHPDKVIDLAPLRPFTAQMAGDARLRSLHAAAGATAELRNRAVEWYGQLAWVLTRDQIGTGGLFGARPGLSVSGRIGDVVLVPRDDFCFIDPGYRQEADLASMHGGLSSDEMEVPLLAARGSRGG